MVSTPRGEAPEATRKRSLHHLGPGRGLALFVGALMTLEILPSYAVTPLIPGYIDHLGLTRSEAGAVVGAYAAGTVLAGVPVAMLARRVGIRRGVDLGLAAFGLATAAYGLAGSFPVLFGTRFVQGMAGALFWVAANAWIVGEGKPERRGEILGMLAGATAFGALIGPVVGGLAVAVGAKLAFGINAVVVLGIMVVTRRLPPPPAAARLRTQRPSLKGMRAALLPLWLVGVPGFLVGAASVIAPLKLTRLGAGAGVIVGAYLLASCLGIFLRRRVGRASDRRGRMNVIRPLLMVAALLGAFLAATNSETLFALVFVCAVTTFGLLWGPALAFMTEMLENRKVDRLLAFGVTNVGAGLGVAAGSVCGGIVAQKWGDSTAFLLLSLVCSITLVTVRRKRE